MSAPGRGRRGLRARELLLDYPGDLPGRDLPAWAWSQLQARLGRTDGLNPHNNGLFPDQPGRPPMTAFVRTHVEDRHNIFGWAARLLSDGRAAEASRSLLGVHGVGSKIAAFLLRDVLVAARIPEDQIGGAHLIQPVDIWVRRAAVELTGDDTLASEGRDPVTARRMVELAAELGVPGAALNCALWVVGARLARSEVALKRALTDRGAFVGLVVAEISRTAHKLEALRGWLEPLVVDAPSDV